MVTVRLLLVGLTSLLLDAAAAQAQSPAPVVLTAAPDSEAGRRVLAAADAELADPMAEARRTLPKARKRFQAGMPANEECLLTVRVVEGDTVFRPVAARVIGWRDGKVQALLPVTASAGKEEKVPVSFPESAVVDWTILRTDGREEGNYVGRYLDTAQQLEGLRLR
jgi:hypothetical protein